MKIVLWCFFICVVLFTSSCESQWHVLEFQNITGERVYFTTQGIRLYAKGGGPQNLSGYTMSYSVMGPLWLSYPVKVSWESKQSEKKGSREFMHIPGIPEGVEKITEGGVLVVGLTPDFELKVFFVQGDTIDSKLYTQILKGEVQLPE
jgi:hypothetical protein